jgi:serine/threonine-protein kinase RIO1
MNRTIKQKIAFIDYIPQKIDRNVLNAIEKLRRDILHIESYESIDDYMRGRRDMIHERLDGLIVHVSNLLRDVRRR